MILKQIKTKKTSYSLLDLIGNDELAISKIFAYLLAYDKDCYFHFLHFLGISIKNSTNNYQNSVITIEKKREEGRTDIELFQINKYHIIIECKIKKGMVTKQRSQYLTAFNKNVKQKILCILTRQRDTNIQIKNDVLIKNINWLDIIELFNNKQFFKKKIVSDFLNFTTRNYRMKEIKEILIQGLSDPTEIKRYKEYCVYRRNQIFGTPLYFAPYFSRNSDEIEGITNISKIMGILTMKQTDAESFMSDLENFSDDKIIVDNWLKGVKLGKDDKNTLFTYYFLDKPYKFKKALTKDRGIKKGRGKNWIAANIPPNRCVSFIDFIKHIPELMKLD